MAVIALNLYEFLSSVEYKTCKSICNVGGRVNDEKNVHFG